MITKFEKLLEKNIDLIDIKINVENENKNLIEKIKQELSIITYKRKNSPKPIRIKEISGYFNKKDFKSVKLLYKTYIIISMSNGDNIKGKLSIYQNNNENNIHIKINDNLIYDLDNKKFNNELLIEKLIYKYKEFILKNYKIR
jgi:hypothetical protein